VRREQIRQVLEEAPEIRRAEIGRRLGISRARAGQLVNMLIQDDIVAEDGRGRLWLREGE
jgi:Mn-dependent DtxR family transcriptional regulator